MAFADGKERVVPSDDHARSVADKYKAILQPPSADAQPLHIERVCITPVCLSNLPILVQQVFKRMLTQHKVVDTTSKWTNRFVAKSTEIAFQTWSIAYYSASARTLMLCVVLVHMLVTAVDFSFSSSTQAYFATYGTTEVAQWAYLVILVPFFGLRPHHVTSKGWLWYLQRWKPYRIPLEELTLKRVIGQGAYGEVILAELCGTAVVLKRMHRHKITPAAIREFSDEILLMCQLRHPNIVQFIGASWNTYSMELESYSKPRAIDSDADDSDNSDDTGGWRAGEASGAKAHVPTIIETTVVEEW
ncbi:hypothetical protein DYB32_005481 [Aphanomyces invadans]|uniref:Protein kinase domain-containing protein n=1 Tax=Aphanomyces invadans TaxID=157072 RepID=A0A3R6VWH6_9STRA|nr:hypothetical protein DYB32_005481 [Aphanomyces invadans]